jgi:hypothetical protein
MIEYEDGLSQALDETRRFLSKTSQGVLYEATFLCQGVLVRADVFHKTDQGHRFIEVKSSTGRKDYHLWDCAVQAWVIAGAGYPLASIELAYIDSSFVYPGNDDYQGLFRYEDLTEIIAPLLELVPLKVQELRAMLQGDLPAIDPGDQCDNPFHCPFKAYCAPESAGYAVTLLPRISRQSVDSLRDMGVDDIRQIPHGYLGSTAQEWVRRVTISQQPELKPEAGAYLRGLLYPRYYLDFETIQFAVPLWAGTRPYQQLPFQWSCHIETRPGELSHAEFLDTSGQAPMRPLAEKLMAALGDRGPIFVYGPFEKMILNSLALMFPDLSPNLQSLIARLEDLLSLTRNHYYHPEMRGSWSLKKVLPTIAPDLDYAFIEEVQDGTGAQMAYAEAIDPATPLARHQNLTEQLLAYCCIDTLALVRLARFFRTSGS